MASLSVKQIKGSVIYYGYNSPLRAPHNKSGGERGVLAAEGVPA